MSLVACAYGPVKTPSRQVVFFLQPGVWILLFIGMMQMRLLRRREGTLTATGVVRIVLISIAYLFGIL